MAEIQVGSWEEEANAPSVQLAISKLKTDPELAIDELTSLAESGSVKSMLYLAHALARGSVVKRDFRRARFWYKKIGERGIIFGDHMAGSMSVKLQEFEQARIDFWRCANAGFLPSIYRKGYMLSVGHGGNKDIAEARYLLKTAANRGHYGAGLYYAQLLRKGKFGITNVIPGIYLSFRWRIGFFVAIFASRGRLVSHWDDRYIL